MSRLSSAAAVLGTASTQRAVTAYLGVGSNVGDRPRHIAAALRLLRRLPSSRLLRTSHLYESSPVGLANQPLFLNAALELHTSLPPLTLLAHLKDIERALGRDEGGLRFGPRVIDLDVLTYGAERLHSDALTLPHSRLHQRRFVLEPLADLLADTRPQQPRAQQQPQHSAQSHSPGQAPPQSAFDQPLTASTVRQLLAALSASPGTSADVAYRVLPLRGGVYRHSGGRSVVLGIVNVTPDSFSDGGEQHTLSVAAAVEYALRLRQEGADVLDVGGESTRPGAAQVSAAEEQRRVLPVIAALHAAEPELAISVDTRNSSTARLAVEAGACLVNDVSGGAFDSSMLGAVAELGVAYCAMHSRGTPESMADHAQYGQLLEEVRAELSERLQAAEAAGIARWNLIQDPGLGFAKTQQHNVTRAHTHTHIYTHARTD